MNALLQALVDKSPSEKGATIAGQGFAYQHNWAIHKLIELHQSNKEDYILICEHHDDILVFDSVANNEVCFYQVKTKREGLWKINDLSGTKNKADDKVPKKSIFTKLYEKKEMFGSSGIIYLFFISNARYDLPLQNDNNKSKDQSIIKCTDLKNESKQAINDKIKQELNLIHQPNFEDFTNLQVVTLSIESPEDAIYKALANYFENQKDVSLSILKPLHKTLLSEIERRANYGFIPSDQNELVKCRGVSRQDFEGYLQEALQPKYKEDQLKKVFNNVQSLLNTPDISHRVITQMKTFVAKYQTDKITYNNNALQTLEIDIKTIMETMSEEERDLPILLYRDAVFNKINNTGTNKQGHDDDYIKFIILFLFYGEN